MRGIRCMGAAVVFAVITVGLGCSGDGDYGDVSGTVKYDSQDIENGAITFIPADGKGPTAGGLIKNGKYTATKVPVGRSKVVISGSKVVGKKKIYDTPNSPEMPITKELLPVKYSDKDKTELNLDVKRGGNEKNWELGK